MIQIKCTRRPSVCRIIPGREIRQVHIDDSDGGHIEVALQPHAEADIAISPASDAQDIDPSQGPPSRGAAIRI